MKSALFFRFRSVILPSLLVLFAAGTGAQDPVVDAARHSFTALEEGPQGDARGPVPRALRILVRPTGPAARAGKALDAPSPSAVSLASTAAAPYELVPLSIEPIGGQTHSRAYGINALGQVAARSSNYDDVAAVAVDRQAFVWDPVAGSQALPTLEGESGVWDINDDGFVSGYSFNSAALQHAVRWDIAQNPVTVIDLGTLVNATTMVSGDTSTAYGLSPLGEVTGYSDLVNDAGDFPVFHAILYSDASGLQDLGTLSTSYPQYQNGYSISYSANSAGQVVGTAHSTEGAWHFRPFIYDVAGGLRELTRASAYATTAHEWYAVAINDAGLIGGHVIAAADQSLPYYWPSELVEPLPVPMPTAYPYGEIYGINASGVMVGIMWNDLQEERAFMYDAVNGVRDLNALVDPAEGWVLEFARDINDQGQIVGSGTLGGLVRGFLLTPADLELSVGDASIVEGDSGTTTLTFTVSLSEASDSPVEVSFATQDGSATGTVVP